MGMPGRSGERLNWECVSLSPADWGYSSGSILDADNTGGSQAAGQAIGGGWEGVIENGGIADGNATITKTSSRLSLNVVNTATSGRITVQTDSNYKFDLTNTSIMAMGIIANSVVTTTASTEIYIGMGNYTQTSPFNGAPNIRGGSLSLALLGSSNTLLTAYNASNTRTYIYDDNVSNPNQPINRKSYDSLGCFIWRSPANSSQSTTTWKWRGGGLFNGNIFGWSESQISGKSVDIASLTGITSATNWGGFFTHRTTEANKTTSFRSLELWIAYA